MQVSILEDYNQMSKHAADTVVEKLEENEESLICFAAGDTPTEMIRQFNRQIEEKKIFLENKRFVSLDEWVGKGVEDEGGCLHFMTKNLYSQLNIPKENICFFDGLTSDLDAERNRIDSFVDQFGPIDILVLGIGMNGHLGFNESGVSFDLDSHVIALDEITKKVAPKYFKGELDVKKGITLGIRQLMNAKKIILIASGAHKAQIVKEALEGEVNNAVPASVLQKHNNVHVFIDQEAGAKLEKTK